MPVCVLTSPLQPAGGRRVNHVGVMTDFAFEMMKKLNRINDHAFTEFQLKIGKLYSIDKLLLWSLVTNKMAAQVYDEAKLKYHLGFNFHEFPEASSIC